MIYLKLVLYSMYYSILKNSIIFLTLIALIWWLYMQNQQPSHTQDKAKPQEYMAMLTITNFNETGKPKETLRADYWAFVPSNGRSDLNNPHVTVYKPNGDIWHLSAHKALAWHLTLGDKITLLDLSEQVLVERTADNFATPTKITTDNMQYIPNKEMLTTKAFISMQQPGLTISGHGMHGFLNNNRIELHEKITTVYSHSSTSL